MLLVAPAWADWFPNNTTQPRLSTNHKMHWPQLPDPQGLDVNFTFNKVLADDWMCSETGPVADIHFWMSSKYDDDPHQFMGDIHTSIHADIPDPDGDGPDYSRPGTRLWARDFTPFEYTVRLVGETFTQDFFDPNTGQVGPQHNNIYQVNITGITDPWIQTEGTVYWLDLSVIQLDADGNEIIDPPPSDPWFGWKTTYVTPAGQEDQPGGAWNDDAVWGHLDAAHDLIIPAVGPAWMELIGPTDISLDMAFVITPEPATLAVLLIGGLLGLARRAR
jgi:hypothetical protein